MIDEYIQNLLEFRAIDQKATADHVTEMLFQDIFKQSSKPKFNFLIDIKQKYDFDELEKKFGEFIKISELKKLNPEENQNFYHAEIDGAILIDLKPNNIQEKELDFIKKFNPIL